LCGINFRTPAKILGIVTLLDNARDLSQQLQFVVDEVAKSLDLSVVAILLLDNDV